MSNDLQTYFDLFGVKPQKILVDELRKSSQFYMHCIFFLHNAAKENGLIDCNGIEDKRLDNLKIAFSIAIVYSESIDKKFPDYEQAIKARFATAFYAGYVFELTYDEKI